MCGSLHKLRFLIRQRSHPHSQGGRIGGQDPQQTLHPGSIQPIVQIKSNKTRMSLCRGHNPGLLIAVKIYGLSGQRLLRWYSLVRTRFMPRRYQTARASPNGNTGAHPQESTGERGTATHPGGFRRPGVLMPFRVRNCRSFRHPGGTLLRLVGLRRRRLMRRLRGTHLVILRRHNLSFLYACGYLSCALSAPQLSGAGCTVPVPQMLRCRAPRILHRLGGCVNTPVAERCGYLHCGFADALPEASPLIWSWSLCSPCSCVPCS